jgi:hypothetical protein
MYLTRKVFVGGEYKHRDVKGEINITIAGVKLDIDISEVSEICIKAGYWRKANHIHAWFVENVQDGEDDCKEYYVPIEQLEELKELCIRVLGNHDLAEALLPTQTGCFFGGTEYDEYYFNYLTETIDIVDYCLKHKTDSYYYESSW